ncbi:hypothetical protein [Tetrasphaera phage TJE1]|uniref:Uncharacterized protein n=1 Tax=Tetrasphaera phage TJE1 TaxID=981335 RepID=G4W977_9CAUD|nr:hypothetical protein G185_gp45 [Tetrasphaera phage TJE1]ADX42565.1 hypothetical protein [Tetrasphaera phage TJE1]
MSDLRNYVEKAAVLSGIRGAQAHRVTTILLGAFDEDLAKKTSAFDWLEGESIEDRLLVLQHLLDFPGADKKKASYVFDVFRLYAYSCAVAKGYTHLEETRDALAAFLAIQEQDNPEVAKVMTVNAAATALRWG